MRRIIQLDPEVDLLSLFGKYDVNLREIKNCFGVSVSMVQNGIVLMGKAEATGKVEYLFNELQEAIKKGYELNDMGIEYFIDRARKNGATPEKDIDVISALGDTVQVTFTGKHIKPKTIMQRQYVDTMREKEVVFAIGPAGTGKTYLAVAMAINYLKRGLVKRIILTRPAVEAGESLGFLPGDLVEKVEPYLRPLYDAILDMISPDRFEKYREKRIVEIAPLAYMRGRTLNNSFIILDEAQNTTHMQMKMFLTRLGFGSRIVVTGDITQIDIGKDRISGLVECSKILKRTNGIGFVYFSEEDVVRHPLVKKIIRAYEKYENEDSSLHRKDTKDTKK